MFVGTFEHSLDDKGRLILPSTFRDAFATSAYLTQSIDGCLSLMDQTVFAETAREQQRLAKAGKEARHRFRVFAAGSTQVAPDKQGRIPVSATQQAFAAIEKGCVVNGAIPHLEIWSAERWAELEAAGSAALIEGDDTDLHLRLLLGEDPGS